MGRADIWFKRLSVAGAGVIGLIASLSTARADIVHHVGFETQPVVIVWSDTPPSQDVAASLANARDTRPARIAIALPPLYGSGGLLPADAQAAVKDISPLDQPERYFHIASNAPFRIDAQIVGQGGLSPSWSRIIRMDLSVRPLSPSAQTPHSGGLSAGLPVRPVTLADLEQPVTLFTGNRKTALRPGSIADQSVRFEVTFSMSAGEAASPKPSDVPEIVFTIYAL